MDYTELSLEVSAAVLLLVIAVRIRYSKCTESFKTDTLTIVIDSPPPPSNPILT